MDRKKKNYVVWLFIFVSLFCLVAIGISNGAILTMFSDLQPTQNLSFYDSTSTQNITLSISKYANVTNATIVLQGYSGKTNIIISNVTYNFTDGFTGWTNQSSYLTNASDLRCESAPCVYAEIDSCNNNYALNLTVNTTSVREICYYANVSTGSNVAVFYNTIFINQTNQSGAFCTKLNNTVVGLLNLQIGSTFNTGGAQVCRTSAFSIDNIALRTSSRTFPSNISINIGANDLTFEFNYSNELNSSTSPIVISNLTTPINQVINSTLCNCLGCSLSGVYCNIPWYITSNSGIVEYLNLSINYTTLNHNPSMQYVTLNSTTNKSNQNLIGICYANDTDNDQLTYNWSVYRNGNLAMVNTSSGSGSIVISSYKGNTTSQAGSYFNFTRETWNYNSASANLFYNDASLGGTRYLQGTNGATLYDAGMTNPTCGSGTYSTGTINSPSPGQYICANVSGQLWKMNILTYTTFTISFDYWQDSYPTSLPANVVNISQNLLQPNDNWTLSCQATDGELTTNYTNATVTILDGVPPIIDTLFPLNNYYFSGKSINLNVNVTDQHSSVGSCLYSVYKSDSQIEGSLVNISFNCHDTSFDVSCYTESAGCDTAFYNITVFANDTLNNINQTSVIVRTQSSYAVPTQNPGSGSSQPSSKTQQPFICQTADRLWAVQNDVGGQFFDVTINPKGQRTKTIFLYNKGDSVVDVSMSCQTSNETNSTVNICQYISIVPNNLSLITDPTLENTADVMIDLSISNLTEGQYGSNIVITDNKGCTAVFNLNMQISALGIIVDPIAIINKIFYDNKIFAISKVGASNDLVIRYYVVYLVELILVILGSIGLLFGLEKLITYSQGRPYKITTKALWITLLTIVIMLLSFIFI